MTRPPDWGLYDCSVGWCITFFLLSCGHPFRDHMISFAEHVPGHLCQFSHGWLGHGSIFAWAVWSTSQANRGMTAIVFDVSSEAMTTTGRKKWRFVVFFFGDITRCQISIHPALENAACSFLLKTNTIVCMFVFLHFDRMHLSWLL